MYVHSTLKMGDYGRSHCRTYGCLNRYYPSAIASHIYVHTLFKEHFANLICDSSWCEHRVAAWKGAIGHCGCWPEWRKHGSRELDSQTRSLQQIWKCSRERFEMYTVITTMNTPSRFGLHISWWSLMRDANTKAFQQFKLTHQLWSSWGIEGLLSGNVSSRCCLKWHVLVGTCMVKKNNILVMRDQEPATISRSPWRLHGNLVEKDILAGWWVQQFVIFTSIWGRFPFPLIFFNWVLRNWWVVRRCKKAIMVDWLPTYSYALTPWSEPSLGSDRLMHCSMVLSAETSVRHRKWRSISIQSLENSL